MRAVTYSQNCQTRNLSGLLSGAPPGTANPSPSLNPGHQSKEHHMPLGWCACLGSSPALALGGVSTSCFAYSFSGSSASNLEPPTMGIAVALSSIATAIPLRWRQMMARSKANGPLCQFGWSATDQTDNNVAGVCTYLSNNIANFT